MTVASSPDVVVVGAGLVGALTALRLAETGLLVTLIDADFAGGGSTGAAMGHLVAMDDSPAQLALCADSRRRWHTLVETLPDDAEHEACGTLWLAANDEELTAAQARIRGYAAQGVRAELLDARGLAAAEPSLAPGLAGALLVPDDGVVYPPTIARELVRRARQAGVDVREGTEVASLAAHEVQLADGSRLATGAIVVATGVAAPRLIPGLPVVPRKGHLVITDRRPGMVRHQLVELGYLQSAHSFGAASVAFNLQPRRTGQVLIGSSRELVGLDASINRPLVARMLDRARRFMPAVGEMRALRTWVGFRPATADKLPLIGRWPALPDLWVATGHEGLGITMAPGTAELIVAGLLGQSPAVDPAPFRPDRPMPTDTGLAA
ncbi:MAG: FAD-dependent oxidoreductase [Gemmatimonadota bacterium]